MYDVILFEYLATGCYRCYSSQKSSSMTSSFWSTLLLVATGATSATARKEFIYDVIVKQSFSTYCTLILSKMRF